MKTNHTGSLLAGFTLMFLLITPQAKAETFSEISLPALPSIYFSAGNPEFLNFEPVQAAMNAKEAEEILAQLGISIKEKRRPVKWDPFKAVRILQTSA